MFIPLPRGASQTTPDQTGTSSNSSSHHLSNSDIIGIAVGVPSSLFGLLAVCMAFLAWRYPDQFRRTKDKLLWRRLHSPRESLESHSDRHGINIGQVDGGFHHRNTGTVTYYKAG
ncbi:hypothetical protein F5Y08DRAFT_320050 [Xylaria arbuscula]|nr:hypothetical protein F5Y08DRAFT_320050 [Xylaria arbuscula]